jgi:2-(1,2-epoxy-1,2-dihydrophenyl)acetyl-CoA isomerase
VPDIELSLHGDVAEIVLSRPDALNALRLSTATELIVALDRIAADRDVRVVLLRGQGRAFCAGGDIVEMASAPNTQEYLDELVRAMNVVIATIVQLPVIVVAAVHGSVAGGGIGLMLSTDIVVADSDTTFVPAYGAVALTPDCGVTALLPAAIGYPRALNFLVGASRLSAERALDWGMISQVCAPGEAGEVGLQIASGIARQPRDIAGITKRMLRSQVPQLASALEREALNIVQSSGTATARHLIGAFASSSVD